MLRPIHLITILCTLASPILADEPMQCSFPEPGRWILNMDQTQTNMGPGGGPESLPFELVVEGCGESILTYGFGGEQGGYEKRFSRTAEDTYAFSTNFRGFPVSVTMDMETPRQMNGEWVFGNFARAPGEAAFLEQANAVEVNPLCHCDAFRQQLLDAIESDEYYKAIYSDPRFAERPEALEPWVEWNWATQDRLISLVSSQSNPVSYADAVSNYTKLKAQARINERSSSPATAQAGDHQPVNTVGTSGYTDPHTCVVQSNPSTGCAADILDGATKAHEDHHSATCVPYRDAAAAHNALDGNAPPTYAQLINNDPAFNAANEVEAYEIGIAYIRDTYLEMCKTPLN